MINRSELVAGLDSLLDLRRIPDVSLNGLQVEGRKVVERVGFAVDAGLEVIEHAIALNVDMLIVHHGFFWGQVIPAVGSHGARLKKLFGAGLSLYAAHLPLDVHPVLGNNPAILEDAGFVVDGRFAEERGLGIGCLGSSASGLSGRTIMDNLEKSLGCQPARVLGQIEDRVFHRAAAITGSGLRYIEQAAMLGADIYLTGEGSHASYHQALESGIPCLFYGHYHSETIGLRRLLRHVEKEYGLACTFIDVPTGF